MDIVFQEQVIQTSKASDGEKQNVSEPNSK